MLKIISAYIQLVFSSYSIIMLWIFDKTIKFFGDRGQYTRKRKTLRTADFHLDQEEDKFILQGITNNP